MVIILPALLLFIAAISTVEDGKVTTPGHNGAPSYSFPANK